MLRRAIEKSRTSLVLLGLSDLNGFHPGGSGRKLKILTTQGYPDKALNPIHPISPLASPKAAQTSLISCDVSCAKKHSGGQLQSALQRVKNENWISLHRGSSHPRKSRYVSPKPGAQAEVLPQRLQSTPKQGLLSQV